MYVIAHQGDMSSFPGNSMDAFESAVISSKGFDMIELDIQMTKDDCIIIFHDSILKNTFIRNLTLKEVCEEAPKVLVFEMFYETFMMQHTSIRYYLDIKGSDSICLPLVNLLENYPHPENLFLASFQFPILEVLSSLTSRYKLGFISENSFSANLLRLFFQKYPLHFISIYWKVINPTMVSFCKRHGVLVFVYTCRTIQDWEHIVRMNVDGVVTDVPLSIS